MATNKKIIIGNWKMNFDVHAASLYLHKLSQMVDVHHDVEVVLAPTLLTLQSLSLQVNLRQFKLAAQNFYWRDHGTYTGEVSASQLRGIVQYALVGHSERRNIFHENNKDICSKVQAAVRNNIKPILIIGETAWERSSGEAFDVINDQLMSGLANITSDDLGDVIIAYEPVWADGTGNNASTDDVSVAVKTIRNQIEHLYGKDASVSIKVLYGGSVTSGSAADYLALPGIDGLLIGNASLHAHAFNEIIKKAHKGSAVAKKD
jgi:triosephosphate isomerase